MTPAPLPDADSRPLTPGFPPPVRPLKFYAVVPDADWVARMVAAGADTVQLRNKTLSGEALRQEVRRAVAAAAGSGSQLFINDYWRLALEEGAYGVHLGQEDLDAADLPTLRDARIRLGISTHSDAELARALAVRPSYVACGAIFPTTTKTMPTAPQGLDNLRRYVAQAGNTPTVAIGGIDLHNAADVLATGVSSLAVVRAVTEAADPAAVVKAFQALWPQ
ncbi:thiamine phosphate synthase [Neisseria shayeganii]|uniref:Thiamine-phosphate synthase n=1 Tax=Neisseria shayeganii TaxID=607712 RepID=A0A7D7NAS7_9NEIS|nr:thiamine phosphate synthase [Neisseria shayeganii]QMT39758.1 thiamine phosphate synthase [Neisseria shayeganii]